MTGIELREITKVYGSGQQAVTAVDAATLNVAPGEFYFLLGPSGCGKTTLLRIIAGLITPTTGRVLLGDLDVTDMPVENRGTALVFQNYALWPHLTVAANLEFGPQMQGLARPERQRIVREKASLVRMDKHLERKPRQLSGGQQQRVALARALAAQPRCLLLDEPLSNLDAKLRLEMRDELRRLVKTTGTTSVYVTHDQTEALAMADRIAVMNEGRVIQIGTPEEVYDQPNDRFVAQFLGETNFIKGTVVSRDDEGMLIETAAGRITSSRVIAATPGLKVECCVRPEKIAIEPRRGENAETGLRATITTRTFLGTSFEYNCRLEPNPGKEWKILRQADGTAPMPPETKVLLIPAPSGVAVLT